jgi:hypothetical protein
MELQATPLNITTLLLVAFAIYVLYFLSKRRLDSNLPVLFFIGVAIFTNFTGRQVDTYLFAGGLVMALVLRFEFLNNIFTRFVLLLEMLTIAAIATKFTLQVFS